MTLLKIIQALQQSDALVQELWTSHSNREYVLGHNRAINFAIQLLALEHEHQERLKRIEQKYMVVL